MEPLRAAAWLMSAAMAVTAVALAVRDLSHRPFAAWALWFVLADWLRLLLARPATAPRPYVGIHLAMALCDRLLILSVTFSFVALVLHTFGLGRTRNLIAVVIGPFAIAAAICLQYPAVRGSTYGLVLTVVTAYGWLASWVAILVGVYGKRPLCPSYTHLCIMFIASSDAALTGLVFLNDVFAGAAHLHFIAISWSAACVLVHVGVWLRVRPVAAHDSVQ